MTPALTATPPPSDRPRSCSSTTTPRSARARAGCSRPRAIEVVAEAASGERALDLVVDCGPELVLLDIGLPGIDGFQVAIAIRALFPRARIVLTSSRELCDLGADRVLACGAAGFVHKADLSRAALAAIVA